MFLVGRLYLAFLPLLSAKVKGHTSNTLNFTAKCVGLCAFKTKCNLKKQFSLVYVQYILLIKKMADLPGTFLKNASPSTARIYVLPFPLINIEWNSTPVELLHL